MDYKASFQISTLYTSNFINSHITYISASYIRNKIN